MTDKKQFIMQNIAPAFGMYAPDYDLDAICDDLTTFDPKIGYVWAKNFTGDELNAIYEAHACRGISFDNGNMFLYPSDRAEIEAEVARLGFDVVVSRMDDATRERCHAESDADDDVDWLFDYLRMADEDLVIG